MGPDPGTRARGTARVRAGAGRSAATRPATAPPVGDAPADGAGASPTEIKLVGALAAGIKLLRHLSVSGTPVGVSQLARDLQLNASTCFNLLKTLVHEGLVEFDPAGKTYRIGLGLVEMARGALEHGSYVNLVRPHLEAIAGRHRVMASLWQRHGDDRVVMVDRADSDSPFKLHMNIGQRLPMYIAALGRCMAAHSGLPAVELRRRFEALRWQDAPSFDAYAAEVAQARARGYAIDVSRFVKGVTTASAAVLDRGGRPILAISAAGFSAQFKGSELRALGEDLRDRAARVARAIAGEAAHGPAAGATPPAAAPRSAAARSAAPRSAARSAARVGAGGQN